MKIYIILKRTTINKIDKKTNKKKKLCLKKVEKNKKTQAKLLNLV
jgi:hypothetical protein